MIVKHFIYIVLFMVLRHYRHLKELQHPKTYETQNQSYIKSSSQKRSVWFINKNILDHINATRAKDSPSPSTWESDKDKLNLQMLLWNRARCRCHHLSAAVHVNPICFRGVLSMQSTSRERQRFTLQQRGAQWRCAGLCCRDRAAGCFTRRATAASHHWTSANRGKHSGESAVSRNLREKHWVALHCMGWQHLSVPLNSQCVHISRLVCPHGILILIITLLYCVFFSRHQQLTKLLSRYINEPIHHKPRESHGKYYY